MCLAGIARIEAVWDDDGARVGRLDDGDVVSLAFVPVAEPGSYVLVQLGIPVEIVSAAEAAQTRALRSEGGLQ
jgi:hydrogenase maturation factor